jgi:hypothetical protein
MLEDIRSQGLAMDVIPSLREAWTARASALAQQRYDAYGDLLYAYLLGYLTVQKEQTFNALLAKLQTATSPRELEVPLWQYTACYWKGSEQPDFATRIGTTVFANSGLPHLPVYKVIHSTDVLHRIASAYGADFYVYDRHVETLYENDQRVQSRRELVLAYYPYGLPETLSARVLTAYTRQLSRTPYTPTWCESLSVAEPLQTPPQSPPSSPPLAPRHR